MGCKRKHFQNAVMQEVIPQGIGEVCVSSVSVKVHVRSGGERAVGYHVSSKFCRDY